MHIDIRPASAADGARIVARIVARMVAIYNRYVADTTIKAGGRVDVGYGQLSLAEGA